MTEKKKRLSLREAAGYSKRAIVLLWKLNPARFLSAALHSAAAALTPYLPLYFTARLVNELAGDRDPVRLWTWLAVLLAASAAAALLSAAARHRYQFFEDTSYAEWQSLLIQKLLAMDFCDVDSAATKDLLRQIEENNTWAGWGLDCIVRDFTALLSALFRILGAVALSASLFLLPVPEGSPLAWMNRPACLLGMLALLAASITASSLLYNKAKSYWAAYDGAEGNRLGFFYGVGMEERQRAADIRTYAQEEYFYSKASQIDAFFPSSSIGRAACGPMGLLFAGSEVVGRSFTGVIYLFVGLKALGGAFRVGAITQYAGALAGLAKGITDLLTTLGLIRENAEFLRPVYQLLDTPNRMYQGSLTTEKRSDRKYEIEFRDVSFRYPHTDVWALRHVSLKFQVGERLAVVGENGSGKTTFIKLLCRLYDPTEGEILLNGINIRKYRYDNYLQLFSVVFQDFRLLSQPLGQNVAAAVQYDPERAVQCLEKAGFGARLAGLPKGLETCLYRDFEEDGVEISGGEAQKIALARVLYHDAPFIVLDEPTAALDPVAEAEVYTKFNDIVEDKTAIYISHRLSSCRFCDEIAVFDHGQVVQQGTHDDLLAAAGGKYETLWTAQAQYYQKKQEI